MLLLLGRPARAPPPRVVVVVTVRDVDVVAAVGGIDATARPIKCKLRFMAKTSMMAVVVVVVVVVVEVRTLE